MKEQWRLYADKFLASTPREQYLVLATGLFLIVFCLYAWVIEPDLRQLTTSQKSIIHLKSSNTSTGQTTAAYKEALKVDPNIKVEKRIAQYEDKLAEVDKKLLSLTTELIDPIQMRYALLELLELQKGVSLVSFELVGVEEISFLADEEQVLENKNIKNENKVAVEKPELLNLYRHGIKIKLKGNYFQLRNYLKQLEALSWKFFWQDFQYNLQAYPESELEIKMYSLSTKQEFIGV